MRRRRCARSPRWRGSAVVDVKFCGLTRAEDAETAVALGAGYVGAIFAGGPREVSAEEAQSVLRPASGTAVRRVGVFGAQSVGEVLRIASVASLDIVQLSYGGSAEHRIGLRAAFDGEVWAVAHVADAAAVDAAAAWFDDGIDAVVLDAAVAGKLGGTGVALDWAAVAPAVRRLRTRGRVVLAGGLRPENVVEALDAVAVDIVDVSSGVELAPGIKDPSRMRAFAAAVRAHEVR
ncbi:MAG TPA: phosphoribosylanthranilate isomerase [Gemmatimonadaceae bacterium]|nr:phosphoribosylanthranilate isomerase [Gemmatimonadaceae bacterium]